jgi:restriction system protein
MPGPDRLPSHVAMAWPTLVAIRNAGGSATNSEIVEAVATDLKLSAEQRAMRRTSKSSQKLLDYRLAWSRTLLKNMGAIRNDAPRHWSLTDTGRSTTYDDIQRFAKSMLARWRSVNRRTPQNARKPALG